MNSDTSARHHLLTEWFDTYWPDHDLDQAMWDAVLPRTTTPDELHHALLTWTTATHDTDQPPPPLPADIVGLITVARRITAGRRAVAEIRDAMKHVPRPSVVLEARHQEQLAHQRQEPAA